MQSVDSWVAIWPPLTLGILAAMARKHSKVDFIDGNVTDLSEDEILTKISDFQPNIVVCNTSFPSIDIDIAFAEKIKSKNPQTTILGFGVFFTLLEEKALEYCTPFDVAIYGEPEDTFEEYIQAANNIEPVEKISGLLRRVNSHIEKNPQRPYIAELDQLPFCARDLMQNDRYILPNNGRAFTLINTGRGCPYPCIFCIANVYYGKMTRKHSLRYLIDEIEECIDKHKIHDFLLWDEIFTMDREFVMDFCNRVIEEKLNISWAATTRADRIDRKMLKKMKESGCMLLGLGIESGSQEILDNAGKKESIEDTKRAVKLCRDSGIQSMGHFIFGLPGETEETAMQTIEFAKNLGLDYMQCYCAVPYPKTKLGEMAVERGWIKSDQWKDFDFGGESIMDIGTVAPDDVNRFRDSAFKSFYFRPRYMFNQLLKLRDPHLLKNAANFLKWMKTTKKETEPVP